MTEDDAGRLARVALACLVEPGTRQVYELVGAHGPVAALDRLVRTDPGTELGAAVAARLARADPRRLAETVLARTRRIDARVVTPEDDEWPAQLADLRLLSRPGAEQRVDRDGYPPVCLWVRGAPPLAEAVTRSVAVVGARACTSYGTHVATEIGYGLAAREWTVVSGGAFGIDAAAHRGALSANGITVAVLACGVDRPYPVAHASMFERIAETGLVVSEWPPGSDPHRFRFLVRNRVIAALTRGTVMVEANARSGARQTLGRAAHLGRSIMVVPGPVTSAMSVGCHQAQRQLSARLVTSYADVLEEVGRIGDDLAPIPRGPETDFDALPPEIARVLDGVPLSGGADAAAVAADAGVPLREALRALPFLRDQGFVEETAQGWRARHAAAGRRRAAGVTGSDTGVAASGTGSETRGETGGAGSQTGVAASGTGSETRGETGGAGSETGGAGSEIGGAESSGAELGEADVDAPGAAPKLASAATRRAARRDGRAVDHELIDAHP